MIEVSVNNKVTVRWIKSHVISEGVHSLAKKIFFGFDLSIILTTLVLTIHKYLTITRHNLHLITDILNGQYQVWNHRGTIRWCTLRVYETGDETIEHAYDCLKFFCIKIYIRQMLASTSQHTRDTPPAALSTLINM